MILGAFVIATAAVAVILTLRGRADRAAAAELITVRLSAEANALNGLVVSTGRRNSDPVESTELEMRSERRRQLAGQPPEPRRTPRDPGSALARRDPAADRQRAEDQRQNGEEGDPSSWRNALEARSIEAALAASALAE